MKISLIKKYISTERFRSYSGIDEYLENLVFSKKAYIPLSILEISLKNSINELLTEKLGENWLENKDFLTNDSLRKIEEAKKILYKRAELISKSKIIAELSFGFWVNLFKKPYEKKLRTKDIQKIFTNLPPKKEKMINREVIYKELNHIRNFRNRVFHYEKVINKDNYNQIFDEIDEVLFYFDKELFDCVKKANNG
ncbi:Abi family protein [Aliarcobacter cryaerophilus]|uniref:Abi family protein n=1 Tax=Aliarcobacter cryaerophilus TaxID=28198 RepID=UPI0021B6E059|nr:Abi family protein [Aliarcobacter cryaerophilus]MCT7470923.1 Abi family protein [Aliarcobacter cryaerophilus]